MGGTDQSAEIVHAGRESHRREMLARGLDGTKKTDDCDRRVLKILCLGRIGECFIDFVDQAVLDFVRFFVADA